MPSQKKPREAGGLLPTMGLLLSLILITFLPSPAAAGGMMYPRALDGFVINDGGTATITGEGIRVVAVQPWDGRILIGGRFTITQMVDTPGAWVGLYGRAPGVSRNNLARLNNDGTLDTTFAPEPDGAVNAIVIQRDKSVPTQPGQSRIYIGGEFGQVAGVARNGVARLGGGDGALDQLFAPATAAGTMINAMLLQANRIVLGGSFSAMAGLASLDGVPCSNLAAVSIAAGSDGNLVKTFSGGTNGAVNALLSQEGYLVVGGDFTAPRKFLARFDPGDLPDGSFSAEPGGVVRALALQPDRMILVGGGFTSITTSLDPLSPQPRQYLARLTTEGNLDPFDAALEPFEVAGENHVASIAMQPDGKILVAGRFTRSTGNAARPKQHHFARFRLDGVFDNAMDPGTDKAVSAIALEPNGRFLIGGNFNSVVTPQGAITRTMLARFYFHGGLDDDGAPFPPDAVGRATTIAINPAGVVTVGGILGVGPFGITGIVKLNPDLTQDTSYNSSESAYMNHEINTQSIRSDGKLLVGGYFTEPRPLYGQLTESGAVDSFTTFLQNEPPLERGYSLGAATALLPRESRTSRPVGTMASEGMMYLALNRRPLGGTAEDETFHLVRVKANGELDETFNAPPFDAIIASINLQDDGKVMVGGLFTQKLVRLHSNGEIDTDFRPWYSPNSGEGVIGVLPLRDGKYIVHGVFGELASPDDPTVVRPLDGLVRMNSDGSIDDTFAADITTVRPWGATVTGLCTLSDGSMIIVGTFDGISDGTGTYTRTATARITQDGKVLDPELLIIDPIGIMADTVQTVAVQADGKVIVGGTYNVDWDSWGAPMNRRLAKTVTRLSTPFWATEDLVVAPGGSEITWIRGGTAPGLWRAWFEEKGEGDAEWRYLGPAQLIDGVWKLSLPTPLPTRENRYVRARGYVQETRNWSLTESVGLYYLKEPVRVRAEGRAKVYGDDNPTSYSAAYLDAAGEPKVMGPGSFYGAPAFTPQATASSGVGDYPITADVSGMTSFRYAFIPENGTLSVTKKTLTVYALDTTSQPGVGNRTFTAGYSGFVGTDTRENSVQGEPSLTTVATAQSPPGSYVITAALGTLRSANYQFAFQNGTLTIQGRLPQAITFEAPGSVTYGDPAVPVVAGSNRGLQLTYESSAPSVAVVENGAIVPKRAGTTVITARQGGNLLYEAATPVSHPFTVRKKELKVSADPKARAFRTPNPALTASYQGFVSGENSSVISGTAVLATAASLDSPVGSYAISVALGTLSADNYFFTPVHGTLTVLNSCQEIVFPAIGERTYGDPPLEITAIACSGLTLNFASSNTQVATVSGNVLTITGAGTSVITASQRGTGDIDPARPVSQSLVVHKRGQAITFGPLPPRLLGAEPVALDAVASSGLPISYDSSDQGVATVSGSTLTIAGAGTTVVTARQEGNGNYEPALPASQPFTVALEVEPPQLSLSTLPSGSATASPVLNVSGSAKDDSGITSLTVNSADLTASAALFSSAVSLHLGENSITVTAKDASGNVASETLSVTLDAAAPLLAVAEPPDNSVTDVSLFTAKGSVPAGSRVSMAVNGSAPQAVAVTSGTFNGTGYLEPGINTVELAAELSERSARAKRTVTLKAGAPPVAITEPGEDLRTEADSLLIKGRAGTGNIGSVLLELNGVSGSVPVEGGVFQQQLSLDQAGAYRIKVTASDSGGNASSAWRNIIKVDRIAGDLDRNGVVDIGDAIALLRISLGIDPATEQAIAHGDLAPVINGVPQPDGRIGVGDVLILLRKIVGLIE